MYSVILTSYVFCAIYASLWKTYVSNLNEILQ